MCVLIKRDLYLKNSSRLSPATIQKYSPKAGQRCMKKKKPEEDDI